MLLFESLTLSFWVRQSYLSMLTGGNWVKLRGICRKPKNEIPMFPALSTRPLKQAECGHGIHKAQEARLLLSRLLYKLGITQDIAYPDISTKEKAQQFIGLDMEKLNAGKQEFLKTIVPGWIREANDREAGYPIKKD